MIDLEPAKKPNITQLIELAGGEEEFNRTMETLDQIVEEAEEEKKCLKKLVEVMVLIEGLADEASINFERIAMKDEISQELKSIQRNIGQIYHLANAFNPHKGG